MNSRGFTILEVFLISVLMIWIITAVTSVLQIGEFSNTVSTARIELQQEVRRAMDTMITDLRQTSREKLSVELANGSLPFFSDLSNDTAFTDPLFKVCLGYNSSAKAVNWSSNEIGYTFNASNNVIVRTDNSTSQAWQFNNISDLEFRKLDVNLLGINITGEKVARGNLRPTFSLQAEVRLRNE
jgi:type II secretory pathway component PulJ